MYKVLIVDDDKAVRYMLKRFNRWSFYGFVITEEASDGKEALSKLASTPFDLVITDIKMPGMNGFEFLSEIKSRQWDVCLILLSTYSDFEYAKQGIRMGVFDYITKPLEDDVLSEALERTKKYLEEKEVHKLRLADEKQLLEESIVHYYPQKQEKELAELLLLGNATVVDKAMDAFLEITEFVQQDLPKVGMILETLLAKLSKEINITFPWLGKIEKIDFLSDMTHADSIIEIKLKFLGHIKKMLGIIRKYELNHTDSIVKKTCQYVMKHVEEEINLEMIATEVHVSKDYIGKLFKQKTGCNFTDYVTKVKMEHAKSLLETGEYKNYEVSTKLGYSSPDYFCRLFKEYTGYTPFQFRKLRV